MNVIPLNPEPETLMSKQRRSEAERHNFEHGLPVVEETYFWVEGLVYRV